METIHQFKFWKERLEHPEVFHATPTSYNVNLATVSSPVGAEEERWIDRENGRVLPESMRERFKRG